MLPPRISRSLSLVEHSAWRNGGVCYLFFFILVLALYAGTYRAGWVYDTVAWLGMLRNLRFGDFLNFSHHNEMSHYQLTQVVTWLLFKMIGSNRFGWLLIHIAVQAANATLLFGMSRQMLSDAGVQNAQSTSLLGAVLFITSPYLSEPLVYKAAFHFLLGMLLMLTILQCLISYLRSGITRLIFFSLLVFLVSAFSLEFFYFTPLFASCIVLFYRAIPGIERKRTQKAWLLIIVPEVIVLLVHRMVALSHFRTSGLDPNLAILNQPLSFYAIKPLLCCFHLFWGRFLPQIVRDGYHHLACSYVFAAVFYGAILGSVFYIARNFNRLTPLARLGAVFFLQLLIATCFASLVWFPEKGFIYCDRYLYLLLPFFYMLLGIMILQIASPALRRGVILAAIVLNAGCTIYVCSLWRCSAGVIDEVHTALPAIAEPSQILLLNNPWSLKGAPMIGNREGQDFTAAMNLVYGKHLPQIIQVADYDMQLSTDGAHVRVLDDSTVQVSLGGKGYWMKGYDSAKNYKTPAYQMELVSPASYKLHLLFGQVPFTLWYQSGERIKAVDMSVRGIDQ